MSENLTTRFKNKYSRIVEIRNPDDMDRIRNHYLTGAKLSAKLEEKRVRMEYVQAKLTAGMTREEVIAKLEEDFGIKKSAAYALVADSLELLGDITKTNKDAIRYICTERLMEIMGKEGCSDEMKIACIEQIRKLNGLDLITVEHVDIKRLQLPQSIVFSDEPEALIAEEMTDDEPAANA